MKTGVNASADPMLGHLFIFACQLGLAAVWKHWGVHPDAVVGQSMGEVAASHVSGALSLIREAVNVIYQRSKYSAPATCGKMIVVEKCPTAIVDATYREVGHCNVAVYSSSVACPAAGDDQALIKVKEKLQKRAQANNSAVFTQDISVQCAYHSHHMETCSKQVAAAFIHDISGCKPHIPIYSTVTGNDAGPVDFVTAGYWARNVRQPVLFKHAIQKSHLIFPHDPN